MSVGLLAEREGDIVKAALRFVVDAHGATAIACEAQAAEVLSLRHRDDRSRDDDVGGCLRGLSEIVNKVACDGDGHWAQARGGEDGGGSGARDVTCRGRIGIGEGTILRADAYGADGDIGTGHCSTGVGAAGEGRGLEGHDAEGRSARCLLARLGAFLYMSGDDVVPRRKAGGVDGGFRAGGGDLAAIGSPGVDRGLFRIQMQGVGFDLNGIARKDLSGLSTAAEHDGKGWLDVAHPDDESGRELQVGERAEAALLSGGKEQRAVHDLGILIVRLNGADGEVLAPEGKNVIEADAAGGSPAPHERLSGGAIGAFTAAQDMCEGHPASQRVPKDGAAFGGIDQLAAGFSGAGRQILFVLGGAGEVASLEFDAKVAIEPRGNAEGAVRIVDALKLITGDLAIEGMEVAVAAVDVDARVNMLFATFCRLRRGDRRSSTKTDEN